MIRKTTSLLLALSCLLVFGFAAGAQSIGTVSSAVWITDCNQSNFFNSSGAAHNEIGPSTNIFHNYNFGVHTQNSGSLFLNGAELRTFKNAVPANVCGARLFYRVYNQLAIPGAYSSIDLTSVYDCDVPMGQYPSGGSCAEGEQKWNRIIPEGVSVPDAPVNLTSFAPGNYVLEIYYELTGSSSSSTLCDETITLNNGGANYQAFFSIQSPVLASNNPTTCNGTEGLITIGGLSPGTNYAVSYTDDGVPTGPVDLVANTAGQVILSGLNAGIYSNFELAANGCITNLFTGFILSNPLFTPTFPKINAICAGTTPPTLPLVSANGITGTWSPAVINNQSSGFYTFTPGPDQCALPVTASISVTPNITPSFSFGSAWNACAGGVVPILPSTSNNGISGTWSPSVVDKQNSGVYTFTPNAGPCAIPTTLTVNISPNITPSFDFGPALTICEGETVPVLPTLSLNGITGTWSPAMVDNTTSGVYNFTPVTGQCAVTTSFAVTVSAKQTPLFSFGNAASFCESGLAPPLPSVSDNGIAGTWSPATVSNQASGTYTFTPADSECALPTDFVVTITPNILPIFDFGTTLTVCAGDMVPVLPAISTNGISGVWSPSIVDNQLPGVYTFTPDPGHCVLPAVFNVTVTPNITPVFSFGTSQTICEGGIAPLLTNTSTNGITGTWHPALADNQSSGVYTFTPDDNQCATTTTLTITVEPNITPAFLFGTSMSICVNGVAPVLPLLSTNGITGTWNPAIANNQSSGTYTFTPNAGQCANPATFELTVSPNIVPTFSVGSSLAICKGGTAPVLPTVSLNGITGTWNPPVTNNQSTAIYTFSPNPEFCAQPASFTLAVMPIIPPTFAFGSALTICAGEAVPVLPTISTNAIAGSWSPAVVSNQVSAVYTFTPSPTQCAIPVTFTVTVEPIVVPLFSIGTAMAICENTTPPMLPLVSDNGITGTWSPAVAGNQVSATYTFTPDAGQCATVASFELTVTPNIIPLFDFGTSLAICRGGQTPVLPPVSTNGIAGSWSPSVTDNQASATYTFTPDAGPCAVPATFTITVAPNVLPIFDFGTSVSICAGAAVPVLPATSSNGISGSWSPAVINDQASGIYTFTPGADFCALSTTFSVYVTGNVMPVFSFGSTMAICAGAPVPPLPTSSTNGVTGNWQPAVVSNLVSGVYTFTPASGTCATTIIFEVTVTENLVPVFELGTTLSICENQIAPLLPVISQNGVEGAWDPAVIDNNNSAVYTFTPVAAQCALPATLNLTVNPIVSPTFNFGNTISMCAGDEAPVLPNISTNNIRGAWSAAIIDNQLSGIYNFIPDDGQCAIPFLLVVNITPVINPHFNLADTITICTGAAAPLLPASSLNGINGQWTPSVISNQQTGTYIFAPDGLPSQCIRPVKLVVIVKPILTPQFSFGETLSVCAGGNVPLLPTTSSNGVKGTWSPATISNQSSATYTFTTAAGQCATPSARLVVTVNPLPSVSAGADTIVFDGAAIPAHIFEGNLVGAVFNWTNSNTSIGLPANGTGNVPAFTATNRGNDNATATITITPVLNGCAGEDKTYVITVKPLNKDVFVPNVFTPNGDGKNDILFVYGNYIDQLEMRIFNQWGQQIELLNSTTRGWDGTHKGKPQPVGVYIYTLKCVLADGRKVNLKGSITLIR